MIPADEVHGKGRVLKAGMILSVLLLAACDSAVVDEAREAEADGRTISNVAMTAMYPETFREGNPAYLERDFEAGADFICAEMQQKFERDVCADDDVNWR